MVLIFTCGPECQKSKNGAGSISRLRSQWVSGAPRWSGTPTNGPSSRVRPSRGVGGLAVTEPPERSTSASRGYGQPDRPAGARPSAEMPPLAWRSGPRWGPYLGVAVGVGKMLRRRLAECSAYRETPQTAGTVRPPPDPELLRAENELHVASSRLVHAFDGRDQPS
jgi:hypothetical protein